MTQNVLDQIPDRYSEQPIAYLRVNEPGVVLRPFVLNRATYRRNVESLDTIKYTIEENQTMQDIALEIYGKPEYWYVIADFNNWVFYPLDLSEHIGEVLTLPSVNYVILRG